MENIKPFIYHISPERELVLIENTKKKIAKEEGIAEDIAEEKLGIATNLLKQNVPIEKIALGTGLSEEELKKISKINKLA